MPDEKAPSSGAFLPASLMYFCSGEPMHFCSGVDTEGRRLTRGSAGQAVVTDQAQAGYVRFTPRADISGCGWNFRSVSETDSR